MQDRVAQHLDLAGAAVAGVDLEAAVAGGEQRACGVVGGERRAVLAHVGLDARQQRAGVVLDRMAVVARVVADHELQLARVVAPGGEQRVGGQGGGRIGGAADDRAVAADPLPQRGRRVEQEQVDVAVGGQRAQHGEPARGQPREAEQREPGGEVDDRGVLAQARAGGGHACGRPGLGDGLVEAPPQLGLPAVVLAGRPRREHLRAVERIGVEQVGDVADGREPARTAGVRGERAEPRLAEVLVHDAEQRPDGALGAPRVGLGLDPGGRRDDVGGQPPRRREVDVRAHAVAEARARAQAGRQPLAQPPLHPARGDAHDLARERIRQRIGEQFAQGRDEAVGPL